MLPTFVPNMMLAKALSAEALVRDSLSLALIADEVAWAASHYAVDNNAFPESAAESAAVAVFWRIHNRFGGTVNSTKPA